MRISIQACIEGEGDQPSKVITVGIVERQDSFAPAAGLGLFIARNPRNADGLAFQTDRESR